jgi:hypothetical protein
VELELTVLEGGRLTWQGSAVQGVVDLTAGSIVRARCRYVRASVELERVLEVLHRAESTDATLQSLATRGLLAEVMAATASSEAAEVLGFRGRALFELGRLAEGVEVLQRALAGKGPSCTVDAWNSPWAAWAELTFEQKREVISRPFLTAVTRWAWAGGGPRAGFVAAPLAARAGGRRRRLGKGFGWAGPRGGTARCRAPRSPGRRPTEQEGDDFRRRRRAPGGPRRGEPRPCRERSLACRRASAGGVRRPGPVPASHALAQGVVARPCVRTRKDDRRRGAGC